MKILVTGATGLLGWDVIKRLKRCGITCIGTGSRDLDITNREAVQKYIGEYCPSAVIHCAAYTAVDQAEDDVDRCRKVNVDGTINVTEACRIFDAKMMYISTDYVFGDDGDNPHEVDDPIYPLNVYGQSKWEGEEAVRRFLQKYFIVRTSWVYGEHGHNFVKTMLRLGEEHREISVVNDQFGAPTYASDLAALLCEMILTEKYGTYHACNAGVCSWAEFARKIFKEAKMDTKVCSFPSAQFSSKAHRPKNSRLSLTSLSRAGFPLLRCWEKALKDYVDCIVL